MKRTETGRMNITAFDRIGQTVSKKFTEGYVTKEIDLKGRIADD